MVAGISSFSTSEQDTGFTWTNGSKIYKKTVSCGALPSNSNTFTDLGVTNLGDIVKMEGIAHQPNINRYMPLPFASNGNWSVELSYTDNKIRIGTSNNYSAVTESYVTVYYTKTS